MGTFAAAPTEEWNAGIKPQVYDRWLMLAFGRFVPRAIRPNHLTAARFALVPIVAGLVLSDCMGWGIVVFTVAAITDLLDGVLARGRRQITPWGIQYDPVADKLLIGTTLVTLIVSRINLWIGLVVVAVEGIAFIYGIWERRQGKVIPANGWGKAKMVFETAGVIGLLIAAWSGVNLIVTLSGGVLALSVVFAVVSVYVRKW